MHRFLILVVAGFCSLTYATDLRSLVSETDAENHALLVSVSYGLPGLDKDIALIKAVLDHKQYHYQYEELSEGAATKGKVIEKVKETVEKIGDNGSFTFYFTGHGTQGSIILTNDELLSAEELKEAIASARGQKPLERVNLIFDACYSGSLLEPWKNRKLVFGNSANFADRVYQAMQGGRGTVFDNLFVFASSSESEVSYAGENGSNFTVSLKTAFRDSEVNEFTMEEWVARTKMLTEEQRPEARFLPDSLRHEKVLE